MLVAIGVDTCEEKHLLAIEDGVRESTQSWREVLLGMKQRGVTQLAVGDGALGFWSGGGIRSLWGYGGRARHFVWRSLRQESRRHSDDVNAGVPRLPRSSRTRGRPFCDSSRESGNL